MYPHHAVVNRGEMDQYREAAIHKMVTEIVSIKRAELAQLSEDFLSDTTDVTFSTDLQNTIRLMFADNVITWSHIGTLYTFCTILCCKRPEKSQDISDHVDGFVDTQFGRWIVENGGWEAAMSYPDVYPQNVFTNISSLIPLALIGALSLVGIELWTL